MQCSLDCIWIMLLHAIEIPAGDKAVEIGTADLDADDAGPAGAPVAVALLAD